jgi:hypothetical protein
MPHLVSAFQEFGEVRTVGPVPKGFSPDAWTGEWPPRGHVDIELTQIGSLFDVLPDGWVPNLVLAISGGGVSMFRNTHDLPCPAVFYSVDTWQCYLDYHEALHYDVVFAGQRAYVPLLRAAGSRHVHWLPMACNPALHRPLVLRKSHDVVFVGGTTEPVHWKRMPLLEALQSRYGVLARERVYGAAMCRAYASGRIAFNHSAVRDVNMRIFEALGMGCALLTNREAIANGLTDLFEDGKHLLIYDDEADMLRKASTLLSDEPLRVSLGTEGRKEVLARHTYRHRAITVLETVRSLMPSFAAAGKDPRRLGTELLDHLPHAPGAVLDYGMALNTSKYALSKRGASRFVGYSNDETLRSQRAGSFDATYAALDPTCVEAFDTVALEKQFASDDSVRAAWTCLVQGGALLLRCDALRPMGGETMQTWLNKRDFHLVYEISHADGSTIIVARKRVRRLRGIAREVCDTLRVPGVDGDVVASMLDPDW